MSRTAAKLNQADIARVFRAARAEGATEVAVMPDGSMRIKLAPGATGATAADATEAKFDEGKGIRL